MSPKPTRFRRVVRRILFLGAGALLLLLLASAASNIGLPRSSSSLEVPGPRARGHLAEALHLRSTLGDEIWPGFGSSSNPQILYNEGYTFLVGHPDPPPGWRTRPGGPLLGGRWEPVPGDRFRGERYYRQRLTPGGPEPQAFTHLVGDRWAGSIMTQEWARIHLGQTIRENLPPVLQWIPPYRLLAPLFFRSAEHHVTLILHEAFHAYQATVAQERLLQAEAATALEERYPWNDEAQETAWEGELAYLADALVADDYEEARHLAQRFLQAREARRAGLARELIRYEREREWLEGGAKYVEVASWRVAAATEAYEPVEEVLDDGDFDGYAGAHRAWQRELGQLRRSAGQGETRFYYSGMALAFLLDRFLPGWKGRAMEPGVFLDALLEEALLPSGGPGTDSPWS